MKVINRTNYCCSSFLSGLKLPKNHSDSLVGALFSYMCIVILALQSMMRFRHLWNRSETFFFNTHNALSSAWLSPSAPGFPDLVGKSLNSAERVLLVIHRSWVQTTIGLNSGCMVCETDFKTKIHAQSGLSAWWLIFGHFNLLQGVAWVLWIIILNLSPPRVPVEIHLNTILYCWFKHNFYFQRK